MTDLTRIYRSLTNLNYIDIEQLISETPTEQLPYLYNKLIWNIPRGNITNWSEEKSKDFAYVVCNLALMTHIDDKADDILPDGVINYTDFKLKSDLEFAHKIIKDCEHLETIYKLITEGGDYLLTEDNLKILF